MLGLGLVLSLGKKLYSDLIGRLLQKLATRGTYSENLAGSRSLVTEIDNAGVLDDATILLTPTAYSNTRVHSVKTYTGENFLTGNNSTFDSGIGDWGVYSGASVAHSTDKLEVTLTSSEGGANIDTNALISGGQTGKTLKVRARIWQGTWTGTFLRMFVGGVQESIYISSTPTYYEVIIKPTGTSNLTIYRSGTGSTGTFFIDDISVVDVSSDFDFDRASSATRINSDGLVQDMQSITDVELVQNGDFEELGDDLVTNGTFDTNSDWTFTEGNGWSISDGSASYDGSGTGYQFILQAITTNSGSIYKINFDVLSSTGSNLNIVDFGSVRVNQTHLSVGNYTYYAEADAASENLTIYANGTDTFSIDNVSVQQVDPNDRWNVTNSDADNYVEFTEGFARLKFLNTSPITMLNSTLTLQANKTYELVVDVHDVTSGAIKIDAGGLSETFNTEGVTTRYLTPTGNATLSFYRATANVDITLASVSIKDITFSEDVDLARINYDSNGENGHWLLEPTSTNLITYSEDFSQWDFGSFTTQNYALAPDGSMTASLLDTTSNNYVRQLVVTSNPSTHSLWVKAAPTDSATHIRITNNNTAQWGTGTSKKVALTNEWQRIDTTDAITGNTFYLIGKTDENSISDADCVGKSLIWGAQTENLSYATSYIPTLTGSTVTRAAETLNGSGNSTLINSTEGVLYAEMELLQDVPSANMYFGISSGALANSIFFRFNTLGDIFAYNSGLGSSNIIASKLASEIDLTNYFKLALKYGTTNSDFSVYVNGVELTQSGSFSATAVSGLSKLDFALYDGTSSPFYGKCKALAVFDRALTDQELTDLTS